MENIPNKIREFVKRDSIFSTHEKERDDELKVLADSIARTVYADPELTSYKSSDEDNESDIEVLDPDRIIPEDFHWEAHNERIKKFIIQAIRSYVKDYNCTKTAKEEIEEFPNVFENEVNFIRKEYSRIIEKMKDTKYVRRTLVIWKLRKEARKKKSVQFYRDLQKERDRQERRKELQMEGKSVVNFWLRSISPEKKEKAKRAADKLLALHIEHMVKFLDKREKRTEQKAFFNDKGGFQTSVKNGVSTLKRKEKEMKYRMGKLKTIGSSSFLMVRVLEKWSRKKLVPFKRLKEKKKFCKWCTEDEQMFRSYRQQFGYVDKLTVEDAKKLCSMLLHNGGIRILKDYFKILLSKPDLKIDEPVVVTRRPSTEVDKLESLIFDELGIEKSNKNEGCNNNNCERRIPPFLQD